MITLTYQEFLELLRGYSLHTPLEEAADFVRELSNKYQ